MSTAPSNAPPPTSSSAPSSPESVVGSCRGCGYALQGLESNRCPECGRAFDPANPKTMNMGRKPGWLAKKLMRPIGWPTVLLMFLGTAAIAVTTRPQEASPLAWDWSFADLKFYVASDTWKVSRPTASISPGVSTAVDWGYGIGLAVVGLSVLAVVCRIALTLPLRLIYLGADVKGPRGRTLAVVVILLLTATICVAAGWQYRLGQNWAAKWRVCATADPTRVKTSERSIQPLEMESDDELKVLSAALRNGPPHVQRSALALLAETGNGILADLPLRQVLESEDDPALVLLAVRLAGLSRDPDLIDSLARLMSSKDPKVRSSSIDALAMIVQGRTWEDFSIYSVDGDPPVVIVPRGSPGASMVSASDLNERPPPPRDAYFDVVRLPDSVIAAMSARLATGATEDERDAAARYFVRRPPTSATLRIGEWGVWVDRVGSDGLLAGKRAVGDVPGFVHQFGDPASALPLPPSADITKPVVHLTVEQPMAVAISAMIRRGRAVLVYPMPDDYALMGNTWFAGGTPGQPLNRFDDPLQPPLAPRLDQIPWLDRDPWKQQARLPKNSTYTAIGFRWHHLIVLPEKAAWMQPPAVPADPKYAWWTRLRDVPSSWVSSRGESERFLYYDGPTLLPSPVAVREADGGVLMLRASGADDRGDEDQPDYAGVTSIDAMSQTARKGRRTERRGMYITVAGGRVTAEVVPVPKSGDAADPPVHIIGSGTVVEGDVAVSDDGRDATAQARGQSTRRVETSAAEALLREWVIDAGLSPAEADGMMFAWRTPFFETEGRRFVLLMSAVDYDSLCPISITPRPTEMARVGLVWTEMRGKSGE